MRALFLRKNASTLRISAVGYSGLSSIHVCQQKKEQAKSRRLLTMIFCCLPAYFTVVSDPGTGSSPSTAVQAGLRFGVFPLSYADAQKACEGEGSILVTVRQVKLKRTSRAFPCVYRGDRPPPWNL